MDSNHRYLEDKLPLRDGLLSPSLFAPKGRIVAFTPPPFASGGGGPGLRSDLDFETDLDDLDFRDAEIGGREIGIEVHRGEEPLPPHDHPRHLAARDDHHPAKVISDLLGDDVPQVGIPTGEPQPIHDIGVLHKSELKDHSSNPGADRDQLHSLFRTDSRRVGADDVDQ